MIHFLVYGIHYKNCPVEIREKLHFRERRLPEAFEWIRREWPSVESLILSTCNRVELYFSTEEASLSPEAITDFLASFHGLGRSEFDAFLYRHEGRASMEHLFRVAAGLDSMVVGENEILGQLREAFRAAQEAGTVDSVLYRLVERALRVGKMVRTKTKINEGAVSIPSVAVELAEKIFGPLEGEKVMVLGTGEMSELTLENLRKAGADVLYIMSRNEERGRTLAEEFGARWVSQERWEDLLVEVDILIASTSAPHPIVKFDAVKRAMAKRRHRPLFLIDIAVPRNIEAQIHTLDDVYLYNIDDLEGVAQANLKLRRREIREAEGLIGEAVEEFLAWLEQLQAGPTIQSLQAYLDALVEEEIERFGGLSAQERERLIEFSRRLRSKFLHAPLEALKDSSRTGSVRKTLESIHSLFRLGPENCPPGTGSPRTGTGEPVP